jgi:hypothetical protein
VIQEIQDPSLEKERDLAHGVAATTSNLSVLEKLLKLTYIKNNYDMVYERTITNRKIG